MPIIKISSQFGVGLCSVVIGAGQSVSDLQPQIARGSYPLIFSPITF